MTLTPVVSAVLELFPDKRVIAAFPPKRHSLDLKKTASGSFIIGEHPIAQSQFPDEVRKPDGYVLKRPELWK